MTELYIVVNRKHMANQCRTYWEQQIEGNNLHNAAVCNQIADESLVWNPNEAVYWREPAVENTEKQYRREYFYECMSFK